MAFDIVGFVLLVVHVPISIWNLVDKLCCSYSLSRFFFLVFDSLYTKVFGIIVKSLRILLDGGEDETLWSKRISSKE